MKRADLIILGAGPAGTSAAITAASAGLRVILIENLKFPRERPGETLHPGVEPLLEQLGVREEILEADFVRHEGHYVEWGGDRKFIRFGADENGTWKGFQAWRSTFDAILLNRARKLGVEIYQPCRAISPISEKKTVIGVETSKKGALFGKFLVDAAGGRHWLAKHLRIKITPITPQLIVRYGYVSGKHLYCEIPSLVADKKGWTWTAEVQPDIFHLSRLVFNSLPRITNHFPTKIQNLFEKMVIRGSDVTWRVVSKPAGAGYFLAGDAASVLDPVSSHGVLKALMSGIMIGYLIIQVSLNTLSASQAATIYSQWTKDWFYREAEKMVELYEELSSPPLWLSQTIQDFSEQSKLRL